MKIGFIGLGNVGGNVGGKLAGSLLRDGFDLTVRDLDHGGGPAVGRAWRAHGGKPR